MTMLGASCSPCCAPSVCNCTFPEELLVLWDVQASAGPIVTVTQAASAALYGTASFAGSNQGVILGNQVFGVAAYAYRNWFTDPVLGQWTPVSAVFDVTGSALCQWVNKGFSLPTRFIDAPAIPGSPMTNIVQTDVELKVYAVVPPQATSLGFICYYVEWRAVTVQIGSFTNPANRCGGVSGCFTLVNDYGVSKQNISSQQEINSLATQCIFQLFRSSPLNRFRSFYNQSACGIVTTNPSSSLQVLTA